MLIKYFTLYNIYGLNVALKCPLKSGEMTRAESTSLVCYLNAYEIGSAILQTSLTIEVHNQFNLVYITYIQDILV